MRAATRTPGSRVNIVDLPPAANQRGQSRGEEIANSLSHGLGLVAALVASPFLIVRAVRHGDAAFIVGAGIFTATMGLLYLGSTLYHTLPAGRAKRVFRIVEHAAIFLLIAGTYTPFTLGVLRGAWGWTLLGLVWGLAAVGVGGACCGRFPAVPSSGAAVRPAAAAAGSPGERAVSAALAGAAKAEKRGSSTRLRMTRE